ncbi:DNA mismatch repair protein MSH3 [Trifolium repens]|nr:DNA mismatch repair protein MSH3 [Trifolium repens]
MEKNLWKRKFPNIFISNLKICALRPFVSNTEMTLSANTLQQLEVLQNNSDGSESGSLLQIMNRTLTIFGSRLLRHWLDLRIS